MKPYIIAEIASSHHGDIKTLHNLIIESYNSGADGIKIQPWRIYEMRNHKRYENLKKFEFTVDEWLEAAEMIKGFKLDLWCEAYSHLSLDLAMKCKYDYLKSNYNLTISDAKFSKMLISQEADRPYESTFWRFDPNMPYLPKNVAVGEQAYPTTPRQGWADISIVGDLFQVNTNITFACHQNPIKDDAYSIPLAAYQAGADIIEKHICLDRKDLQKYSKDYLSSFEPDEFRKFVDFMKTTKVSALL